MRVRLSVRNIPRSDERMDSGNDGWFIGKESRSAKVADGEDFMLCTRIRHA